MTQYRLINLTSGIHGAEHRCLFPAQVAVVFATDETEGERYVSLQFEVPSSPLKQPMQFTSMFFRLLFFSGSLWDKAYLPNAR